MVDTSTWAWWETANDRRCSLIYRKHLGNGISADEEVELAVLQDLTEAILNKVGPELSIISPLIGDEKSGKVIQRKDGVGREGVQDAQDAGRL